jgi:DNA repair protein RadC
MDSNYQPNIALLARLIGTRAAKRLYRGELAPLFQWNGEASQHTDKLVAARELVTRWLDEELKRGDVLCAPAAVRAYLRLLFAQEEREIFAVLFLDGQHRLIAAEKLFYGTLSQTAVHPREVVKRALQVNAGAVIFAQNHHSARN